MELIQGGGCSYVGRKWKWTKNEMQHNRISRADFFLEIFSHVLSEGWTTHSLNESWPLTGQSGWNCLNLSNELIIKSSSQQFSTKFCRHHITLKRLISQKKVKINSNIWIRSECKIRSDATFYDMVSSSKKAINHAVFWKMGAIDTLPYTTLYRRVPKTKGFGPSPSWLYGKVYRN